MARVAGVNIPDHKTAEIALTAIFGIGRAMSGRILRQLNIPLTRRMRDLSEKELVAVRTEIEKKLRVEGELKNVIRMNIKRLREIGCYRGTRHQRSLPVHGQRTRTNSRTVRGNVRKTMGSGRKIKGQKT